MKIQLEIFVNTIGITKAFKINQIFIWFMLFLYCFLSPISTKAQHQNVQFENITIEDGLSNNSCYCTIQDQDGYIWFASDDGLNRWDGYNFKVFRHNPDDSTSNLSSAEISIIFLLTISLLIFRRKKR